MRQGIIFNEDDTHFFYDHADGPTPDEAEARRFIRGYQGTQITDFMLCCAGRISGFPSSISDSWMDKYDQRKENDLDVDYRQHPVVSCATRMWREKHVDFYAVCLDELRRIGINPWLSVRMNDCHLNDQPAAFLHPAFFHAHPEYRRIRHRAPEGYFDRCYDYALEPVRAYMREILREIVFRYDAYGIELDWMRELYCFAPGGEYEGIEILNGFMREARAILNEAEARWGHPIRMAARVPASPQAALDSGFDAATWAREGLVDILAPSPRWATCDGDLPVEMWTRLLAGTKTRLSPCVEILCRPYPAAKSKPTSVEIARGLAAEYLSMGADSVYLFNYFDMARLDGAEENHPLRKENYRPLLNTLGAEETVLRTERRHMLTYPDAGPIWRRKFAALPLKLPENGEGQFLRLRTGKIPEGMRVEISIGVRGAAPEALTAFANSRPLTFVREERIVPAYTDGPVYVFAPENASFSGPFLIVEIHASAPAEIDYLDARVFE